jgi:hypothetical protein
MLNHIALLICCILSVEWIINSNFKPLLISLKIISKKVFKVLKSESISDCWKEKVIPSYAFSMFNISIKSFFILLLIIIIFYLPTFLLNDFIHQSISMLGIIESIIFCTAYLKIRKIIFE